MKASAGRVLMLVENSFPADSRVRNEAFTLVSNGFQVTVLALRKPGEKLREIVNGVTVYRMPRLELFKKLPKSRGSSILTLVKTLQAIIGYVVEYGYFTSGCIAWSFYISAREGFDAIHAHNPPDMLFIVGTIHKLFGKKFVFDHHDLSPELYLSRYKKKGSNIISRTLLRLERRSLRLADVAIMTNESYRASAIERHNIDPHRLFIVRNGPDLARVRLVPPDPALKGKAPVILGYVGAMNPQDGLDYLLRALRHLRDDLGRRDFYCVLIGDGDSLDDLRTMSAELSLTDNVWFTGFIPDADVLRYLSTADICLDPNPSSPLNDVSTWIKVMEYMALGKPIVSFDLKETRTSAADAAVYVPPNDELAFAKAIALLMDAPELRARMGHEGRHRVETKLHWGANARILLKAYDQLFGVASSRARAAAAGKNRSA